MRLMKRKVLVEISGGVAYVTSDSKDIEIAVIDYDVDGCPVTGKIRNAETGCMERAAISHVDNVNPAYVQDMFLQI